MDSTLTVSNNSQWVTSRWKCRHSISIGLSQALIVCRYCGSDLLAQPMPPAQSAAGRAKKPLNSTFWISGLWFATPFACVHECQLAVFIQNGSPAVYALVKIGGAAVLSLIEALKSGARPQRIHALRTLAENRDHRAIQVTMQVTQEDTTLLQHWAQEGPERPGLDMLNINPL
jgi:hypothetical protein